MDLKNTELTFVNFEDLNVNDIVIVDGFDAEQNKKFNKELGTVAGTDDSEGGTSVLIAFNDWFDGHNGNVGLHGKCSGNNCWWFWVDSDGNTNLGKITFYKNRFDLSDIFSSLNENEEDWYMGIVSDFTSDFEKQKGLSLVKVIDPGYYYSTYLDAMYELNVTGLNDGKYEKIRSERRDTGFGFDFDNFLLAELPFLGIPKKGDICYLYDNYYRGDHEYIYKLKRVSDGKEFIMSDFGFRHL
jgi:hypothetical protein